MGKEPIHQNWCQNEKKETAKFTLVLDGNEKTEELKGNDSFTIKGLDSQWKNDSLAK